MVAMVKCQKLTLVQQVELCSRNQDQPKTALKQTIDHTANLTPSSAKLLQLLHVQKLRKSKTGIPTHLA